MIYCNYFINAYKTLVVKCFWLGGIPINSNGGYKAVKWGGCKPVDFFESSNLFPSTKPKTLMIERNKFDIMGSSMVER